MDYGFLRCATMTPDIKVGDISYNVGEIKKHIDIAKENDVKVVVFPELVITGYTCGDLFLQTLLINESKKAISDIAEYAKEMDMIIFVGFPFSDNNSLYNAAAVISKGRVLGIIPKTNIPNYTEFYEARHFQKGKREVSYVDFNGEKVPFGTDIIFKEENNNNIMIAAEICEDLWVIDSPGVRHASKGATIIANLSASDEITGKDEYRKSLVTLQSARLVCAYLYCSAGEGESSTDLVFSGHNMIAENGILLDESKRLVNESVITDIDIDKISFERRRINTFPDIEHSDYLIIPFSFSNKKNSDLKRFVDKSPFVPSDNEKRSKRCEEIFMIQSLGLKKRLAHTSSKSAIIGISGGLDSTLALLVTVKAFDMLKKDRKDIIAVTMPGFGTTGRTYNNAVSLIKKLGCTLKEISIKDAVLNHFKDIDHDINLHDITYENAQARQRTYLLMNLSNKYNGLVIGTGDMSELALGWATYNGDHMSMYGVNSSIPKTLVRYLVEYYGQTTSDEELRTVLFDVLDTPVSPELLPPDKDGEISQKTEDLVGPYELHDFYLYNILRFGFSPRKVYYLAKIAFKGIYEEEIIKKWLIVFYRRFFSQQFKRSCMPDGVKVGSVSVSPRGDLRMPSDASANLWIKDLEKMEEE